jgi:hypothetical protein
MKGHFYDMAGPLAVNFPGIAEVRSITTAFRQLARGQNQMAGFLWQG